jgi:hypothetical protein
MTSAEDVICLIFKLPVRIKVGGAISGILVQEMPPPTTRQSVVSISTERT